MRLFNIIDTAVYYETKLKFIQERFFNIPALCFDLECENVFSPFPFKLKKNDFVYHKNSVMKRS